MSADEGMLRLGRIGNPVLARLEIHDSELATSIDDLAATVDRTGATERRGRTKVVAWSTAAVVSLVLVGIFGVPAIADRLTPFVPNAVERRFGEAVDAQVRSMLDTGRKGQALECGHADAEKQGRAALDRLVGRLEAAASLAMPLKVAVLRKPEANAIALPGGHIYVFEGLISKAQGPDEVAGVVAPEIGHVAHRDGTRSVLQAAGLSFLFGMVLGDFVGGGAVIIATKALLQTSYSREVERRADAFGSELMTTLGGDPRALGAILVRIDGTLHAATPHRRRAHLAACRLGTRAGAVRARRRLHGRRRGAARFHRNRARSCHVRRRAHHRTDRNAARGRGLRRHLAGGAQGLRLRVARARDRHRTRHLSGLSRGQGLPAAAARRHLHRPRRSA